ncbi:hypothetical protein COY27_04695 [Candidatus Woesearchaeota archaeon CG_4_10_14_0_2_um_filter_33_13]|nr:MAG: hypothetical protein COY27_04695 [Candidatus Woesearchaeota archaeon CG_4_10_14_0_2_um_filter_33_13]
MARDGIMMVATGQQRVGKTYQTTLYMDLYVRDIPSQGWKGQKVLIFDTNMEYTQYKSIHVKNIKRFTAQKQPEIRRILPLNDDGSIMGIEEKIEVLKQILACFAKGLILLEDLNSYLVDARTDYLIAALTTVRHREVDVMIHYQTLAKVPPLMRENTAVFRLHKQQETIDGYKGRLPFYELLKIGEYLVNQQYFSGNERFFCYVSGSFGYIKGKFDKKDLENACRLYAEGNSPETKVLVRRYKGTSNAYEKAVNEVTKELMVKYYKPGKQQ